MSMHKIPLTPIEESGLRAHGLDIGKPSQLSDAFRQGVRYAIAPAAPAADTGLVEALGYQVLFDAIAAATSVYANGAINISVQAFRESLAAHSAEGVV